MSAVLPWKFYLGTHQPDWLKKTTVPLFISRRRLARYKRAPKARGRWALDSGGFSELSLYGRWATSPEQYADEVQGWQTDVGRMDWAAVQDWMCEPQIRKQTGLGVEEHQRRTIQSYHQLVALAPHVPWTPVLQGWEPRDYEAHLAMYDTEGVDLRTLPLVGLGSICRRQGTDEIIGLIRTLRQAGLRLHGFGVKKQGLAKAQADLSSADSLAWSYAARRQPTREIGEPTCRDRHANCANCLLFALKWRRKLIEDTLL